MAKRALTKIFAVRPGYRDAEYRIGGSVGGSLGHTIFGALGGGSLGFLAGQLSDDKNVRVGSTIAGASIGALLGGARKGLYDAVQGTSYDYDKYKTPDKPGSKVIIGVSGGGGGPGGLMEKTLAKKYGGQNVAMFNWRDRSAIADFVNRLPEDVEIEAHGWSYGGSTLMEMVRKLKNRRFRKVYTYDPVSWTERTNDKPENVSSWVNVLPGDTDVFSGGNYIARVGGVWRKVKGAENIEMARRLGGVKINHSSFPQMLQAAIG